MKKSANQNRNSDEEIEDYLRVHGTHKADNSEGESDNSLQDDHQQNWGSKKSSYYAKNTSSKAKARGTSADLEAALELKEKLDKGLKNEDYTLGLDLNSSDTEDEKLDLDNESKCGNDEITGDNSSIEGDEANFANDEISEADGDDLKKYVDLYEALTEELDEFWSTVLELCVSLQETGVIPEPLQHYIEQRYHLTNLLIVNLSFALLLGSKQEIESHEVCDVIHVLENKMALMKSKEKESGYLEMVQKIVAAVENQTYFECVAKNTEDDEHQGKNEADNKNTHKKSGKKFKKKTARIVKKDKFTKQANKWQSVVPKQRDQNAPYEGERFGIRKDVSRSTKLS